MRQVDFEFANDVRGALEQRGVPGAWFFLFVVAMLLGVAVIWAHYAKIQQTAVGTGRVIPSKQVQVVENLEPGFVREILVSEGSRVKAGELLVRLDETSSSSRLGELRQKQIAFTAEYDRLEAQAKLRPVINTERARQENLESFYQDQQAVLEVELKKLAEQLRIRRAQFQQKQQLLEETNATSRKQRSALDLAERELELTTRLFKRKAVPEIEYLRIQRVAEDLRGDLDIITFSKSRLEAEVLEAQALVEAEESAFTAEALERKSRVAAELSVVAESIKAAEDAVRRTELRAPVGGIVNQLNVATLGEVVQSGSTIAEIVPEDDRLLIETKIRPKDIAFIRPGLKAKIRLSAYDYTKYGTLDGVVERIGADTITDEEQETFYQVIVATDENAVISDAIEIKPGMVATVDVETGERTVLEYLLKPVLRINDKAFREPT